MISRAVIGREVSTDTGYLDRVIKEGLALMPLSCRNIKVTVRPEDAELLRAQGIEHDMSDTGWRLVEDGRLARGDCRIVSDSSRNNTTHKHHHTAKAESLL